MSMGILSNYKLHFEDNVISHISQGTQIFLSPK